MFKAKFLGFENLTNKFGTKEGLIIAKNELCSEIAAEAEETS